MTPEPASPRGTDYAILSRQEAGGLLNRRLRYYIWKIALTATALALGGPPSLPSEIHGGRWLSRSSWLLPLPRSAFSATMPGIARSSVRGGPTTASASRVPTSAPGSATAGGPGTRRHHAHPNTEGADPDIMLSVLAFSATRARGARNVQRLVFRYQAYLFIPMLFFEAAGLHAPHPHVTRPGRRQRAREAVLLAAHFAAYLGAVFFVLSPVKAVVFILVQQGLFGFYLGCSFAPNHKGMPVLAASDRTRLPALPGADLANVHGGRLTDFALGGLNYQIEHHLFPSMPRPNLARRRHWSPRSARTGSAVRADRLLGPMARHCATSMTSAGSPPGAAVVLVAVQP